jgi:hypothetical protein
MLHFYYTTHRHNDGYFVGRMHFVDNGNSHPFHTMIDSNKEMLYKRMQTAIERLESIEANRHAYI